jgi:hypothetical protein
MSYATLVGHFAIGKTKLPFDTIAAKIKPERRLRFNVKAFAQE